MTRVSIGDRVHNVPPRAAAIMSLVAAYAERLSTPEKVKLTISCAGRDVRGEIAELVKPPSEP